MTIKQAALLAFVGTLLIAVLRVWDLVVTGLSFARGVVSASELISSLIYAFGACALAIFFAVFQRRQS